MHNPIKPLLLLLCVGLLGAHNSSAALAVLDTAINPANGHAYHLLETSNWTDAEAQAVLLGGHLVTINDSAENDWVWNRWANGRSLWIGLNDVATEGVFVWASGEPVTFTKWRGGEPNDGNFGEDHAYMFSSGYGLDTQWNDYQNSATIFPQPPLYGVVEVGPVSSDDDGDGVVNEQDQCPNTAAEDIVDVNGCSIGQLCPCEGPTPTRSWKNHGQFVSCIGQTVERFFQAGLITDRMGDAIMRAAARSSCGKKQKRKVD